MPRRSRKKKSIQIPIEIALALLVIAIVVIVLLQVFEVIDITKMIQAHDVITTTNTYREIDEANEGVCYDDFQIHFMMLDNDYAGDSIYIKAGDTDILIDGGSRKNSYEYTKSYVDTYCTDNTLEYVIATHADQDHIVTLPSFAEDYKISTIITNELTNKSTATYNNMITAFTNEVINDGATWYYAADCFNNTNGAKSTFELSDKVTMTILYNYYYFNKASDENDYSVCTLFTYDDGTNKHYFYLGGDLEKSGEEKMVEYYDGKTEEKTLPEVDLYKAGHHGSKTSSNEDFLEMLKPKMSVVCCCCGTDEYTKNTDNQFPTQDFIDRIAVWTDALYVTTVCDTYEIVNDDGTEYVKSSGYKALNGNIIVSCGEEGVGLACSNNTQKLKDSWWFNEEITLNGETRKMRTWPSA